MIDRSRRTERANGATYEKIFAGMSLKQIKLKCKGIDGRTLGKVKKSERVFYSKLATIARCTRTRVGDWILHDGRIALPATEKFYESLKWSYYLSHNDDGDGKVVWREEEVEMRMVRHTIGGKIPLTMRLRGSIRSWQNGRQKSFTYIASKSNDYYLGIVAHSTTHANITFHGIMSHVLHGALCGLWIGLSPRGNRMAVYRMILSPKSLKLVELEGLSNDAPVEREIYVVGDDESRLVKFEDEK